MTGYAARKGEGLGFSWMWDLRSVNGKGLDLRLRLPDWIEGLEPALRAQLVRALGRGNVSLGLKIARDGAETGAGAFQVNLAALGAALQALALIEETAMMRGVSLRSATTAEVLGLRGITHVAESEAFDPAPLCQTLLTDFIALLADFQTMRATEGAALAAVLRAQIDEIDRLSHEATEETLARAEAQASALKDALARMIGNADRLDETRLMQELALIAVKSDITEELDRLTAHIAAARTLLSETGAIGRKFDFLMQEFMREANTLCSKSQSRPLTRIGLDLKAVIDQMREQVQNVE
jgi:uncharacterized protein (TIGR00255 family)